MVKRDATPLEIAAVFPDRSWDVIARRLASLGATYLDFPHPYKRHLTYCQYRESLPPEGDREVGLFETDNHASILKEYNRRPLHSRDAAPLNLAALTIALWLRSMSETIIPSRDASPLSRGRRFCVQR